ncbi:RNA methyltransferase TrmH, group 3 [Candidatus Omnitrophus magneticus]|uniref:RNA methyltransferase TrmH, group 3 n=1 Tax=Candidatus Omnitrophus magneticus TaxID=1609969 RepID=A0A0F0CMS4_9BACT|nr:RNA methyltransferase TrmH, group 3 [Candidatus Omnitrophus magneticus]
MFLYGKNPVLERLRVNPVSIKKIYIEKKKDLSEIVREIKKQNFYFESLESVEFLKLVKNVNAQGVAAVVDDFKYIPYDEILNDRKRIPIFLDSVTDPQNLGGIIRTLACMSGFSIVLSEYNSAHITETVLRVSSGGENYVPVAKTGNLAKAITIAKERGFWVFGAAMAEGAKNIISAELKFPLAIVFGAEGTGIRPGVMKHIDEFFFIPMDGASLSYNVAVATALFCYEIRRKMITSKNTPKNCV